MHSKDTHLKNLHAKLLSETLILNTLFCKRTNLLNNHNCLEDTILLHPLSIPLDVRCANLWIVGEENIDLNMEKLDKIDKG